MVAVSVILPVFNGAKHLDETLSSISAQTFENFEVLCVDDCSSDGSDEIVFRHARRDPRFRYFHTGSNLGMASKAANFVAKKATGTWFVYSSQDDLFSIDWLEKMHSRAVETGADAVLPEVEFYYENAKSTRRISGYHGDHTARLTGHEAFKASLDWTIPGNALWPIRFLKEKGFCDFGAFADEYSVRTFFLACQEVVFCTGTFFYRQDNSNAVTKKAGPALLDEGYNNFMIWRLIVENGFDPAVHSQFALRTLRSVIRARSLIIRTPSLANECPRIKMVWKEMQTEQFRSSLKQGALKVSNPLFRWHYLLAHLSFSWFLVAAYLSASMVRFKKRFLSNTPALPGNA
ncbi:glycosyltransferase family 2 protein [uncultured Roseobacter sp.]|uniref:glycosyltransferase family 2 protein n=1 Tax=uncultured Roseobacter sp. TaxID=114847 RepID=UPI00260B26A9|nr:glycosyltransferase family 2 protein [uncultured Roseobacter sp.]